MSTTGFHFRKEVISWYGTSAIANAWTVQLQGEEVELTRGCCGIAKRDGLTSASMYGQRTAKWAFATIHAYHMLQSDVSFSQPSCSYSYVDFHIRTLSA
jgi:hypothetical protein